MLFMLMLFIMLFMLPPDAIPILPMFIPGRDPIVFMLFIPLIVLIDC